MSFPLYRRPGGVAFLDDDPAFLDMLGLVLPEHWHVRFFLQPHDCINALQQEPSLWEMDAWKMQSIAYEARDGRSPLTSMLNYWKSDTERYRLTRVCMVDYYMPAMNGIKVLDELCLWAGTRVLLTGQADESIAVTAFNQGLIDRFVTKQSPNMAKLLSDIVTQSMDASHSRHEQIWRSTLTPQHIAWLNTPSIGKHLNELLKGVDCVEHVVIGKPFGILMLNAAGQAFWLQLESMEGLAELAELARSQDMRAEDVAAIQAGSKMPNLELSQALGLPHAVQLRDAVILGGDSNLHAALFELGPELSPGSPFSYAHFIAGLPKRSLQ